MAGDPMDPKTLRFPLTRYFLATGLVTAVVVAVGLSALSAQQVRAELLEERQDFAQMIARHVNQQIHERFELPRANELIDLERPDQLRALDEVVRGSISGLGIRTVNVFGLHGRIEYSTNLADRGRQATGNDHLDRALRGVPSTDLLERSTPLDVSGEPPGEPLLVTYVPVYELDAMGEHTQEVHRVIEIYQDASKLASDTERAMYRAALLSSLAVIALMLALWLWIRKAEQTIDERTGALVEANERLAALSLDLERQVEDRSSRLLRAETLATVGTLGAGVAHEVNNPMAAIASCAEGLLRRTKASPTLREHEDFADFPEYLEIIRSEAFRVKDITRNLLDFSRQSATKKSERIDLRELLVAVDQLLAHQLRSEQKSLELDLPNTPVSIEGDGAGLRQLILNLTVNAVDATGPGGMIRWSLATENGGAVLICEDDGPGFSEDDQRRGLEPFYTRKPTGHGTGLGLALAYGVAREHGGSVELTNKSPGPGARVLVHLAATREEEETS